MCHNHSHVAADNAALDLDGPMPVISIHLSRLVTVELPGGMRLTIPSNSTLFVPLSMPGGSFPWPPPRTGELCAFIASAMELFTTSADTGGDE